MDIIHHYAILRIVPNPARGERVNVGIVVFLEDRMDIHISSSLHKVRAIDPRIDIDRIFELPEVLNNVVSPDATVEQRHRLLRSFGITELTELGWFQIERPEDYGYQVEKIMNDLVNTHGEGRFQTGA